jgi:hypothetical protein
MKPEDKAKELVDKFLDLDNYNNLNLDLFCDECGMSTDAAKQCALIAVDEILDASMLYFDDLNSYVNFWQQVKQEIQNL